MTQKYVKIQKSKKSKKQKSKKSKKSKKQKSKKSTRQTYKKMRGGIDLSHIKISAKPALHIATNTAFCFLNQLVQPTTSYRNADGNSVKDAYDTFETTKYSFGSYDTMISSLNAFIEENKEIFENTILDVILKEKKEKKEGKSSGLPAILKIITDLKIVSSNLAYFFTKNPQQILDTSIIKLLPSTVQPYLDSAASSYDKSLESILKKIISPLINNLHNKPPPSSAPSPHTRRSSQNKSKVDIIEQIKQFIMKGDYNAESENGWYLSTILLELITNMLINLDLTNSVVYTLAQLNSDHIMTCELINYFLLNKTIESVSEDRAETKEDINFNFTKLYNSIRLTGTESSTVDADYDVINDFTILDFFNKDKNPSGILPPFILLLTSIRINPSINVDSDKGSIKAMEKIKTMLKTMIKLNTKIDCDAVQTNTTAMSRVRGLFSRRPETVKNKAEEEEEDETYATPREEPTVINTIETTCSPQKKPSTRFEKFKAGITEKITEKGLNRYLNPIIKQVCTDLNNNTLSWKTLDGLNDIISNINTANTFLPIKGILQYNICYSLAPYTTFFPLDITRYISTKIFKENDTTFLDLMAKFENNIITSYKNEPTYVDPLCIPMSIMNTIAGNVK